MGVSARYRIVVQISAENQQHPWGELIPTQQDLPFRVSLELAKGRNQIPVASWEIPADGRIHEFSCESWIDGDWTPQLTWQNGPSSRELQTERLVKRYLPNSVYRTAKNNHSFQTKFNSTRNVANEAGRWMRTLLANFQGPWVKIHSVALEPLISSWPPQSHQMLYGNATGDQDEIRALLFRFAQRAFRRPVTNEEMEPYVRLVLKALKENRVGAVEKPEVSSVSRALEQIAGFSETLEPVSEGVFSSGLVDLNASKTKDYFGLVCEGKIKVPRNGEILFRDGIG